VRRRRRLTHSEPALPATVLASTPSSVRRVLSSPGRPLDAGARGELQSRFGRDFSRVRIHTDAAAADSAAFVQALAYTVGEHIVFARDRYEPGSRAGMRLLAHELAHVARHGHRGMGAPLLRQAARGATRPPGADSAQFVEDTIRFLQSSAEFWSLATLNDATLDRVLTSWYSMIVRQEKLIDDNLGGDALLRQRLRGAYMSALRVLMGAAARMLATPESELYRRNSGRIPLWAWQVPHHLEPGISTPIAAGRSAARGGEVRFSAGGVKVTIARDATDDSLGDRAETRIFMHWTLPAPHVVLRARQRIVTGFTPPAAPTARIQTFYGPRAAAQATSGYGRGTTGEDVAGGAISPRSTQLSFHEGTHGLDFVAFLESHPPPAFVGAVGMTQAQFMAVRRAYHSAMVAYERELEADSTARTDCVGTTIDVFNHTHPTPGRHFAVVCRP
jgi:hypothetical protein